ncbi:1-acyl-sn-glycerol-3-phosphate acyltransferase [Candidatus Woesearchaeota archaeon]|nr:1-acyl-sn-glycerol-3-phosphate acyltransferase [Candidatus Woesearchaeota archaeon]
MKSLKELVEESFIKKLDYKRTCLFLRGVIKSYCDVNIYNKKNLPDKSAVLAFNHSTVLDGGMVSVIFSTFHKKTHFWVQYEGVYEVRPDFVKNIEQIPVKVENKMSNFKYFLNTTIKMSLDYMYNTNDYICIFPQGSMSNKNYENEVHSGIAYLIERYEKKYNEEKQVVPMGLYIKDEDKEIINKYGGLKRIKLWNFFVKNFHKKIGYHINIGEPLYLSDLEGDKNKKSEIILEKCKELRDEIKYKVS